jgi:hypothetical protein
VRARSNTSTQVLGGVAAFHDATSSLKQNPVTTSGEVHEASSQGWERSPRCGSSYVRWADGRSIRSDSSLTVVPSWVPCVR